MKRFHFIFLLLASFGGTTAAAQQAAPAAKTNPALPKIEQRSQEIAAFLADTPRGPAGSYTDRELWEAAAKRPVFKDAVKRGESALKVTLEPFNEEAYREFFKNGNRSNYQNIRNKRFAPLQHLVIAECVENKGRFVPAATALIRSVCDDKSWVLPAHDRNAEIVDGKNIYVDLVSAATSFELAVACYWLGDKLPADVHRRVAEEIERRTFVPYEKSLRAEKPERGMWWMVTNNNWNAVCHSCVVGAAMLQMPSNERRALYIAAAEHYMDPFFRGFTPDGYCSEGIGYWNYGFGCFVDLAETVYRETGGKVDLFARPEVKNVALFGPRMEITPNLFAAFADCGITARPDPVITGFLSRRLGFGLEDYEKKGLYPNAPLSSLARTGLYCFPNSASARPAVKGENQLGIRTEFDDAGIYICRPKNIQGDDLAAVFKGGHNGEHHNHNDVGSFVVARGGVLPLIDPGGEVYTQRTFSGKRYDSALLNSFGHPVPRINGKLQQTGSRRKGVVIGRQNGDAKEMYLLDISPAYDLKEVGKLTRRFTYDRSARGAVEVADAFELTEPGTFETALVTYEPFKNVAGGNESSRMEFIVGDEAKKQAVKVVVTSDVENMPFVFEATVIEEDSMARKKPTRLGFRLKEPVRQGTVTIAVSPL